MPSSAAHASSPSSCGYGATADAYHITLPSPGGAGALRAARRRSRRRPRPVGRRPESAPTPPARRRATWPSWRPSARCSATPRAKVSISATKSAIGHTLGAAGAIGGVAPMAMRDGCVPPTLNLTDPDRRRRRSRLHAAAGAAARRPRRDGERLRVRRPELHADLPAPGPRATDDRGRREAAGAHRPLEALLESSGAERDSRSRPAGTTLVLRKPVRRARACASCRRGCIRRFRASWRRLLDRGNGRPGGRDGAPAPTRFALRSPASSTSPSPGAAPYVRSAARSARARSSV